MRAALVLISLFACSDAAQPPPISDSDAKPPVTHTGGPTCTFDVQPFALPTLTSATTPLPLLTGETACAQAGALDWFLADFDEDGRIDLAVTGACDDVSVGTTRWLVYPNTGTGFGAALSYAIPQAALGCASFALADVDADGALDLVVTSLCTDATVGTSRWLVYRNIGGTFASSATTFALPSGAATGAFDAMESDAADCSKGKPAFAFFDVTGDAFADLVVTTACDDASVGVSKWRVYPGSASGLGAATSFVLPGGAAFGAPFSGTVSCSTTQLQAPGYTLTDFDGDGKVDLLVTQSCTDASIGTSSWLVYANGGAAFASSPTVIALPNFGGEATPAFPIASGATSCAVGTLRWALADEDGDFKPDLIVTGTCSSAPLAAGVWLVYPNMGSSFGESKSFALPTALGAPTSLESALSCSSVPQVPAFEATHFFGDELDLIVTQACADKTVGASRWLVYRPGCAQ
jgi:hypothetical protein